MVLQLQSRYMFSFLVFRNYDAHRSLEFDFDEKLKRANIIKSICSAFRHLLGLGRNQVFWSDLY